MVAIYNVVWYIDVPGIAAQDLSIVWEYYREIDDGHKSAKNLVLPSAIY